MKKLSDVLLIIDLQNGVCNSDAGAINRLSDLVSLVNGLIQKYQTNGLPIIFVQHNDIDLIKNTESWKILSDIALPKNAFYVDKTHADSFFNTNLNNLLNRLSVKTIEICGAQTQYCVDTTVKVAHSLKYDMFMKRNATTTYDNDFMSAEDTIKFYENIWDKRFLTLYDQ